MRKILLTLFICSCSLLGFAGEVPSILTWKTDNGVEVWFVQRPQLPILDVRMVFPAGSVYDGQSPGLASLTANGLNAGTQSMDERALNLAISQTGSRFWVSVTHDYSMLFLKTLSQSPNLDQSIKLLHDLITQPSFSPEVVKRFQRQVLVNLQLVQNDADYIASRLFAEALYQGTPYAQPTEGTMASVSAIQVSQLKSFFAQHYVANQAVLVLVGNVDTNKAKQLANVLSEGLPSGKATPFPFDTKAFPKPDADSVHRYLRGAQTAIVMGQRGIAVQNPDYYPLMVGNTILGGQVLQSRLFKTVRTENGLAYGIDSAFSLSTMPGPFSIEAKTKNASTVEAVKLIASEVEQFMQQGPTEAELKLAKQALIGSFPLRWSSNGDLADRLAWMAFYHYPTSYWKTYPNNVQAVTADQIKAAFQHWIHPSDWTVVTVGGTS